MSPGWSDTVNTSRSGSTTSRYSPCQWISTRPASIVIRHAPPARTSIATVWSGTSPLGAPNQSANASGSVHSRHTRSRGAWNTRVSEMSASSSAIRAGILPVAQPPVQPVEARLPEASIAVEPRGHLAQRLSAQPRRPQLGVAAALDQAGALEHPQVLGDRLHGDRERRRDLLDARLALGEASEDRAPRGIGERGEGRIELVCHYSALRLINRKIEYDSQLDRHQCNPGGTSGRDPRTRVHEPGWRHRHPELDVRVRVRSEDG